MGADKPFLALPAVDLSFVNHLPYPLRLLSAGTLVSDSSQFLQPQTQPEPKPTDPTTLSNLRNVLLKSLQSVLSSYLPGPLPAPARPSEPGCAVPRFRPYVAKVPWHGGARAFLSQLFPRYGHYCGPNWSSGKAGGSMLWDLRPIDWLDFCCYCHDIGYDTHDQGKLLKADLAFLECLERPQMATKGGAHISLLYRFMCIAGLRYVLTPYRIQLLRLQSGPSFTELIGNWTGGEMAKFLCPLPTYRR
ncbi:hypothetical protein HPP92_024792 [Vanilla planifolia]|uniref:Phospholipase A2 family protein n=1 Tax=Vanilla planifolia TaxID=51239 RepID=A0A835U9S2_VANPL|nr:hypothetical protein HPP92_025151 [Vanilla planifolia]KAG0453488.1 hypothetical protein HPP92_024792 [Vanilla planifolia]